MTDVEKQLADIGRKLDLIAHLLLLSLQPAKMQPMTEQIAILTSRGMSATQIGEVIGRKANYVSAMKKPIARKAKA